MNSKEFLHIASLAAILLASSCAAPSNDANGLVADPDVNHPILAEPDYRSIKLSFSAAEAGLMPDDNARFLDFVDGYLRVGSGSIAIAAAPTREGDAAILYFGQRLAELGVPRARIMAARVDGDDSRIELNYVGYKAHVAACGDWSVNAGDTSSNLPMPNFGCAVQHNLAAVVSDPRDLISPRNLDDDRDDRRRATVFDKYEKGDPTDATKGPEQSASVSSVGK